jgi:hypothetical protein
MLAVAAVQKVSPGRKMREIPLLQRSRMRALTFDCALLVSAVSIGEGSRCDKGGAPHGSAWATDSSKESVRCEESRANACSAGDETSGAAAATEQRRGVNDVSLAHATLAHMLLIITRFLMLCCCVVSVVVCVRLIMSAEKSFLSRNHTAYPVLSKSNLFLFLVSAQQART